MLEMTEIDTGLFKAHSLRAASSSKGFQVGVSMGDILKMGDWSNESVWQKHYNKQIGPAEKYQKAILDTLNKDLAEGRLRQ